MKKISVLVLFIFLFIPIIIFGFSTEPLESNTNDTENSGLYCKLVESQGVCKGKGTICSIQVNDGKERNCEKDPNGSVIIIDEN